MAERKPRGTTPYTREYKDGTFAGQYRDARGRKVWTGGHRTRRTAERAAVIEGDKAQSNRHTQRGAARMRFKAWDSEHFWPARRGVEDTTYRNDALRTKRLYSHWADVRLVDIGRLDVQTWVNDLAREPRNPDDEDSPPLAPATVRKLYYDLSKSLRAAVAEGVLEVSPCQEIRLPVTPPVEHRYLTDPEVAAIFAELGDDTWQQMLVELLLDTGLRMGEATGLHRHRCHLDGDDPHVEVVEVYDPDTPVMKPYPKGRKRREVPVSYPLAAKLAAWFEAHPGAGSCGVRHRDARPCRHDLAITTKGGAAIDRHNFARNTWGPAREGALAALDDHGHPVAPDVADARPHDLRHTYAAWAITSGVALERLQQLMGHVSWTTTLSYAHLMEHDRANIRELLGARHVAAKGQQGETRRTQVSPDRHLDGPSEQDVETN